MPIQLSSDVARPESADDLDHLAWIAQHIDLGGCFDAWEAQLDEALKYERFHELTDRAGDCLSIDVTNLPAPLRARIYRFTLAVALATFRP